MTVREAENIAAGLAQRSQLPHRLNGVQIRAADYVDEDTLKFFKSDEPGITLADQQMVDKAFARLIQRRGGGVVLVPIKGSDYFKWLEKLNQADSLASRAKYISLLTAPARAKVESGPS
jgi:hypothetical protein